ncbi:hypothetical protein LB542_29660 [Mesorhizobium sp. BR1-1-9]|uniref:hypothetical protein n=1 Tax=unclassified Mesorhizobium TaxID=325217 RepID=UPI0015E356CF|nr:MULTISPECIES: hypothetical protein [unclassified Mesorhizobium]MBZ9812062.1 hypothetical protein [Mesorhizobium sp. ESP-6-2]MBZ9875002.1 hypothetical protein [Mesorhizobium sp. BR1-1-9]MBZ9945256.1 hypothetical protein [Mesorhizobium sp. BR1-1-13]
MCKTLKTDIKLFAAAIVAPATVLGANVSLADVVASCHGGIGAGNSRKMRGVLRPVLPGNNPLYILLDRRIYPLL